MENIKGKKEIVHPKEKSLIELLCKRVDGKKTLETLELYQVLEIFDKHYNEWHSYEEN